MRLPFPRAQNAVRPNAQLQPSEPQVPRGAGWWIIPVTLLVAAAVAGTAWWLLAGVAMPSGAEAAELRSEVARTALAAGAGAGAAVTLMLAFRRQRHQEIATVHTVHDAAERRITDLYVKAADQLGSDKAPVRLAGLYALERLAQNNPAHQQTIVNVICAYLRMPYTLPEDLPEESGERRQAQEERQVRMTAQRILTHHLRDERDQLPPTAEFWPGMDIDLSGANLAAIELSRCHMTKADFTGATFPKGAVFAGATFQGDTRFTAASFIGYANFEEATFYSNAEFGRTSFSEHASFERAIFQKSTWFTYATFDMDALFAKAIFHGESKFAGVTFQKEPEFAGATFSGHASFDGATFNGQTRFDEATFADDASFGRVAFTRGARFDGATFTRGARFDGVTVSGPTVNRVWPAGWVVVEQEDGTGILAKQSPEDVDP